MNLVYSLSTIALVVGWALAAPVAKAVSDAQIVGRITLPPRLHPRNFMAEALRPEAFGNDSCGGRVQEPQLAPVAAADVQVAEALQVRIIPIDPSTNVASIAVKLSSNGTFSAVVPPSDVGYCVAVNAGKLRLGNCVAKAFVAGSSTTVDVDLATTIETRRRSVLGRLGESLAPLNFTRATRLQSALESLVAERLSVSDWTFAGTAAADAQPALNFDYLYYVLVSVSPPRLGVFTGEDRTPYVLRQAAEIPSGRPFTFGEGSVPNVVATQPYATQGLRVVTASPTALVAVTTDAVMKVSGLKPRELLEMVFAGEGVRSFGFRLANGAKPGASSIRRAFRVRAYDETGALVGVALNHYTNQVGAASFYGLTVNSDNPAVAGEECIRASDGQPAYCERPIRRVTVEISESVVDQKPTYDELQAAGDPFYIDDLVLSSRYAPQGNIGWKSNGWELTGAFTPAPDGAFSNRDRDNPTSPDPNAACTYVNNWSGGKYWAARYPTSSPGGWVKKTLETPAFTLTFLPIHGEHLASVDKWLPAPINAPYEMHQRTVRNSAANSCSENYEQEMDPNDPNSWTDTNAPVEWTTVWARCRLASGMGDCPVAPWSDWTLSTSLASMSHWSHIHYQQHFAAERSADGKVDSVTTGDTSRTKIYQEYSTDNGGSWRRIWWQKDEDHRGRNGIWYHSHNHAFPDSDVASYVDNYKLPWESATGKTPKRACRNTDFYKSGWRKKSAPYDKGVYNYDFLSKAASGAYVPVPDGRGARDSGDTDWDGECREWETEFYQDYDLANPTANLDNCCREPSFLTPADQAACTQVNANGCYMRPMGGLCGCKDDPTVLGTTMRYRFVFETNASSSEVTCTKLDGPKMPCEGIKLDDVALNNDTDAGYYTNFESFTSQNLGGGQ